MPLKNFQYNKILRQYDQTRLKHKHLLDNRFQEIYEKIPAIKELDAAIASNAVESTRLALSGNDTAISDLQKKNQTLSEEKQELLMAYGYPKDYLKPSYDCPDCKDTGYIEALEPGSEEGRFLLSKNKCHCFKQAIVDLLYTESNQRAAIARENFDTFSYQYFDREKKDPTTGLTPYENMQKITTVAKNFIANFDRTFENLLLYGSAGVGKTFLTNCISKELLDTAHTVVYLPANQLFDILEKYKFSSKYEEDYQIEEKYYGILDCDLLIIDDLGTELNNNFINSQLYVCINERLLAGKSTIISTNFSLDDLSRQYSERIFSRITSSYRLLRIFGDDIRLKKAFAP